MQGQKNLVEFNIKDHFKKLDVLDKGHVELFDGMISDPSLKVVNAARVSFQKESNILSEKDIKLTKYLYEHGHLSTFRHSYFSFRIKAPLFVFRQWWKYQVGSNWNEADTGEIAISSEISIPDTSWNEASGRYVELQPEFHIPNTFRRQSKDNKQGSFGQIDVLSDSSSVKDTFIKSCDSQYNIYKLLIDSGVAKEQARLLLPQNIYTECIWTCSLQTLIHFFNQRLKDDAQFEIREYAYSMYSLLLPFMQNLIEIKHSDAYTYLYEKQNLVCVSSD